jgi:hypothetical protein
VAAALRAAGLLAPENGHHTPKVLVSEETLREAWPPVPNLGPDPLSPVATGVAEAGPDVHVHVHLDRVEVVHPAPGPPPTVAPRVVAPVRRRPVPTVDHDAYLLRRRENRR